MLIKQLLNAKGDRVYTVNPDETLSAIAALLHTRRVGAFVVTNDQDEVVGIISERDLVRAVAVQGEAAMKLPVRDIMTRDVIYAVPGETLDTLLGRMTDRRIRHLPVIESGRLAGIVSIGDLVKAKIAVAEAEAQTLKAYIAAG
jgi:CBS domain-containing protein